MIWKTIPIPKDCECTELQKQINKKETTSAADVVWTVKNTIEKNVEDLKEQVFKITPKVKHELREALAEFRGE